MCWIVKLVFCAEGFERDWCWGRLCVCRYLTGIKGPARMLVRFHTALGHSSNTLPLAG
jgi:hypothetical protein